MKKRIICLSIIAGLCLSVGVVESKKVINTPKTSSNSILLCNKGGQVLPPPEAFKPLNKLI